MKALRAYERFVNRGSRSHVEVVDVMRADLDPMKYAVAVESAFSGKEVWIAVADDEERQEIATIMLSPKRARRLAFALLKATA